MRLDRVISSLGYGFIVFALLKPDSLEYIGLAWLDGALVYFDVAFFIFMLLVMPLARTGISGTTVAAVAFWSCLTLSTYFGSQDYIQLIKMAGPAISICLLIDFAMQRNHVLFIRSCCLILCALYTINFATILMFHPEGMYNTTTVVGDNYFMGFDNGMIYNLIPMCLFCTLFSLMQSGRLITPLTIYAYGLAVLSVSYVFAVSGMIQMVSWIILIAACKNERSRRLVTPYLVFMVFFTLTALIVLMNVQVLFSDFLQTYLGKDASLTGRTALWTKAISIVEDAPLWGTGASTLMFADDSGHLFSHPHCLVLDVLSKGGLVLFAAFLALMHCYCRAFEKSHSPLAKHLITAALAVLLLGEVVGSMQFKVLFWGLFTLVNHAEKIDAVGLEYLPAAGNPWDGDMGRG